MQIAREAIRRQIDAEMGATYAQTHGGAAEGFVAHWLTNRFLSLMLFYKRLRLGTCRFIVSEDGMTRSSKMGTKSVSWPEVQRVSECSVAYLIELEKGAMPIPFRCMNVEQRESFDALVARKCATA